MTETTTVPANQVEVGATILLADGRELLVSRIEPGFMGMPGLTVFIEDSPRQWFKAPMSADAMVEVVSLGVLTAEARTGDRVQPVVQAGSRRRSSAR